MESEIEDILQNNPDPISPAFDVGGINEPVTLHDGKLKFSVPDKLEEVAEGEIAWVWQPTTGPKFEAQVDNAHPIFESDTVEIETPSSDVVETFASGAEGLTSGIITGHISKLRIGAGKDLKAIRFHLPNFEKVIGGLVSEETEDGVTSRRGRIVMKKDGWVVKIDSLSDIEEKEEALKEEGGFGVTHVGLIEREDSSEFSHDEVEELIEILGFLLSFARGLWSQPILIDGYGSLEQEEPGFVSLKNRRLDAHQTRMTWFSKFLSDALGELLDGFCDRWEDEDQREALCQSIGWYLEANGGTPTLQSRLILAQVALELMAHEVLTDNDGNEPEGRASKIISELLDHFGIPTHVPQELELLRNLASVPTLKDNPSSQDLTGPETVVRIRNAVVHSKRAKRKKRRVLDTKEYVEAWRLSIWYLEMVILSWCGYDGEYSSRLETGWQGEHDTVPWN
jgi:hypothetical protein